MSEIKTTKKRANIINFIKCDFILLLAISLWHIDNKFLLLMALTKRS